MLVVSLFTMVKQSTSVAHLRHPKPQESPCSATFCTNPYPLPCGSESESFGLEWQPTRRFLIDAGYVFGFENSVTGAILTPGGALAENVTLKSAGNSFQLAFSLGTRGF